MNVCHKVFQTKQYLQRHQKTVHVQQGISCDQCEKHFTKKADLKRHKNTVHEKKYSCKVCAKKISRSDQSSAHYIKCKAKNDRVQEISLTMHTDKTKFEKNNRFRRRL